MRRVYGDDSIAALVLVHDTAAIDTAAKQFFKLQEQFEDVLDWYQSRLPADTTDDQDEETGQQQQQRQGRSKGKRHIQLARKAVSGGALGIALSARRMIGGMSSNSRPGCRNSLIRGTTQR